MDKTAKNTLNKKIFLPFIVALIGVLVMIAAMFLPYMTAQGELAEYIALLDRADLDELNISANPSMITVDNIVASVYGEDDGTLSKVIVFVFGGFVALTALFVLLKKPIAVIVFNLLSCGAFAFLNLAMREDFIDPDKYVWGIGYYAALIAAIVVFAGTIWMLVTKIIAKRNLSNKTAAPLTEIPAEQTQ